MQQLLYLWRPNIPILDTMEYGMHRLEASDVNAEDAQN